jgi:molybdenum cofactor guanylyltransferase
VNADLVVAILAGGSSTRMGRPKATITIGGLTLIERLALAVGGAGLGEPIVVGGDPTWAGALRCAPDLYPAEGPLGGLLSAFHATTESAVFLLACDLVSPDRNALGDLAARFRTALTANPEVEALVPLCERREVLHAIYDRRIRERLQRSFDAGTRSLERSLQGASVVEVASSDVSGLAMSLQDADTPEAVASYCD